MNDREWIRVEDDPPKPGTKAICWAKLPAHDSYDFHCLLRHGRGWEEPYYGQDISPGKWHVTHYMALPAPPAD